MLICCARLLISSCVFAMTLFVLLRLFLAVETFMSAVLTAFSPLTLAVSAPALACMTARSAASLPLASLTAPSWICATL